MLAFLRVLQARGNALCGAQSVRVEPLWTKARESSEVARVRVSGGGETAHVFAKILKPVAGKVDAIAKAQQHFRNDVNCALRVSTAMNAASSDLAAVRPLVWDETLLALATEEAVGETFDRTLQLARWPAREEKLLVVEAAIGRIARWIASFQEVLTDSSARTIDLHEMRNYIDVRLVKLTHIAAARFREADRLALLSHIDRRAAQVPVADLEEAALHGDVTPSNIIVNAERVTLLDFAMAARGCKYLDVARIYTQLDFLLAKPYYRPRVIRRLQARLLTSFQPRLQASDPLFELCAIQHMVCHFLSHSREPGSFPSSAYSRRLRALHRRWLQRRIDAVETNSPVQQVMLG